MTDREMMIELLAMALWQDDGPGPLSTWSDMLEEDKQIYRDMVLKADVPLDLYKDR